MPTSWFCSSTPKPAVPSTAPICLVAFSTPAAEPAIIGCTSCMATVVSGAKVAPSPSPITAIAGSSVHTVLSTVDIKVTSSRPRPNSSRPVTTIGLPPTLSLSRSAYGPSTTEIADIGRLIIPAASGPCCCDRR